MSANCEEIKPLLTDYALREIDKAGVETIQFHLSRCVTCRQEFEAARNMLGLLQRAEMNEELPRSVRVVAQTENGLAAGNAGWWPSLWNQAGRVAFAGGALACLAVGLLGIFQATVSYGTDGFRIAFGRQSAVVATAPMSQSVAPATISSVSSTTPGPMSREEVEALIAGALQGSERRLKAETAGLIKSVAISADERRTTDLQQMAETFRYMQATQTNMWKEQLQSQQIVAVLAQKNGMNLSE